MYLLLPTIAIVAFALAIACIALIVWDDCDSTVLTLLGIVGTAIFAIIGIVFLIGTISVPYTRHQCKYWAQLNGYEYRYSVVHGCLIRIEDRWIEREKIDVTILTD